MLGVLRAVCSVSDEERIRQREREGEKVDGSRGSCLQSNRDMRERCVIYLATAFSLLHSSIDCATISSKLVALMMEGCSPIY